MNKRHILTLEEALIAIKLDEDSDGEIAILLASIDDIAKTATGVQWHKLATVPPLAKMWARLYLQIHTGFVSNPIASEQLTSLMKQMQYADVSDVDTLIDIYADTFGQLPASRIDGLADTIELPDWIDDAQIDTRAKLGIDAIVITWLRDGEFSWDDLRRWVIERLDCEVFEHIALLSNIAYQPSGNYYLDDVNVDGLVYGAYQQDGLQKSLFVVIHNPNARNLQAELDGLTQRLEILENANATNTTKTIQ